MNVITLLCSVRDLLPVTKEQNAVLGLPVAFDASTAWAGAGGAPVGVARLWPHANHHVLAFHTRRTCRCATTW